ncbi:DUF2207 domain-containing protein [Clostridium vincentii]|uniref:DUF2207 domain-containing protein n=1 Tax=Clostridium vincentii TaxID=52704 RepID=A0A2T0BEP0_9CLOT|nr:DUF2207 domain-containing protein [Clostridium vincentii]PRR82361.1 hypothetical protein CLVI_18670 [Clostridium vincentii]
MKKIITVILMLFLIIPAYNVSASTGTYSIDEVNIDATINKDGTIDVVESSIYNFDGSFNGITRDLKLGSDNSYDINEVKVVDSNGKEYIATNSDSEEDNNYQIIKDSDKTQIKLFSKSNKEPKTFIIKYRINNALRSYEGKDILNWNFYTVENVDEISKGTLTIGLNNQSISPENSSYEIFMDGDWNTEYKNNKIFLEFGNLTSILGVKATLPKDYFTTTFKTATEDEMNVNFDKGSKTGILIAGIGFIIAIIVAAFIVIKLVIRSKKVKKYRSLYTFNIDNHYDSPPMDISPALVSLIYNEGKVGENMISATLFYLANKGYFTISEKQLDLSNKSKNDLVFKFNSSMDYPKEEHLKFLINWFMGYGQEEQFSLGEIAKSLKNTDIAMEHTKKEEQWKKILKKDGHILNMFIKIGYKEELTNEFYNERFKWISYKSFIQKNIVTISEVLTSEESGDILNYASVLEVDKLKLENFAERLSKLALKNSFNQGNNYCNFTFYPLFFMNMSTINNNVSSTGGGFSGVSGGGGFSGGGGGGGGAF